MIGWRAFKNAAPQLERELGINRTEAALLAFGIDCDAVEWDWPRWGRRILVSGPWDEMLIEKLMTLAASNRVDEWLIDWNLYFDQLRARVEGAIDPHDRG